MRLLYVGEAATEESKAAGAANNDKRYAVSSSLLRCAPQSPAHCILFCPNPTGEIIARAPSVQCGRPAS